MQSAIGFLEVTSIARGIECSDAMMKVASVELEFARYITKGKYIILVTGGEGDVRSSVTTGVDTAADTLLSSFVIANVHPQVVEAIRDTRPVTEIDAIGVVETWSVADVIRSADVAVKSGLVELIELNLAKGIGGKAFFNVTGEVGAVRSSINAAWEALGDPASAKLRIQRTVIPQAHKALRKSLLRPAK